MNEAESPRREVDARKSRAVVLYFGPNYPWPKHDPSALDIEFGTDEGEELKKHVEGLVNEIFEIPIDWQVHSLETGTNAVVAEMRLRHPELSDEAIKKLGTYFGWLTWHNGPQ
jgi:hypothetical protein